MIRRPPRSTQSRSSAASDVYKRQTYSYRVSATSNIKFSPRSPSIKSGRPWYAVSKATAKRVPSLTKHKEVPAPKVNETVKNKKADKASEMVEQQKGSDPGSSHPEKEKEETKNHERSSLQRSKYTHSELQTIQSRIKDSLRQQGVVSSDIALSPGPISLPNWPGYNQGCKFRLPYRGLPARACLLYTSPSPRDATLSRMPSSA